ncbi:hypothetical protein M0802_009533 [Mischocyttarus mexicanus]|nr:hypothetical protein M0802_009533 [Mischocyttarus mexicanus]
MLLSASITSILARRYDSPGDGSAGGDGSEGIRLGGEWLVYKHAVHATGCFPSILSGHPAGPECTERTRYLSQFAKDLGSLSGYYMQYIAILHQNVLESSDSKGTEGVKVVGFWLSKAFYDLNFEPDRIHSDVDRS